MVIRGNMWKLSWSSVVPNVNVEVIHGNVMVTHGNAMVIRGNMW